MSTPNGDLTPAAIAAWRARSQRLWGTPLATPMDAFAHLGAVQSQEIQPSKLTPAMRSAPDAEGRAFAGVGSVDALIESGEVIRTHVLRPTWHTIPAVDLRMMLAATSERVLQLMRTEDRTRGLDAPTIARGVEGLAAATAGGRHLNRVEAAAALEAAGVADATGARLSHMLAHAELRGAICSGTPAGGKQTYANFDERVPGGPVPVDEAVLALARRFFVSRGPATLKDFTRWASLKVADAKAAVAELELKEFHVDGRVLYAAEEPPEPRPSGPVVDFVQGFDEMLCSYTDTKEWVVHHSMPRSAYPDRPRFNSAILLDGQVIGHWKGAVKKERLVVETLRVRGFTATEVAALRRGAERLRVWFEAEELDLQLDSPA